MPKYRTEDIRNLVVTGGPGSGKTTLVEAMLAATGVIGRAGRVEDGNTVCDYDDLEKKAIVPNTQQCPTVSIFPQ